MAPRLQLQTLLKTKTDNVYFQPPSNVVMKYPCIVYHLDNLYIAHADNLPYRFDKRYVVTIIDTNPDSSIPDSMLDIESISFQRSYAADNLNHWVFQLYF